MTYPTIHLNGTAAEELRDGYLNASAALHNAALLLDECAPNGRDYYPQGAAAIDQAVAEHAARVKQLAKVYVDLAELAGWCQDAIDAREARRKEQRCATATT